MQAGASTLCLYKKYPGIFAEGLLFVTGVAILGV
jgi:hypothetical protein